MKDFIYIYELNGISNDNVNYRLRNSISDIIITLLLYIIVSNV